MMHFCRGACQALLDGRSPASSAAEGTRQSALAGQKARSLCGRKRSGQRRTTGQMGGGMAYNDFTLEMLKEQFDLDTDERGDYFVRATPATISPKLRDHLDKYVPLALAIGTQKARSEFIIAPVLLELLDQYERDLS